MKLKIEKISWPLQRVFRISRNEMTEVETVTCTLTEDGFSGRGEGIGVNYHGESIDSICEQLESARAEIESCSTRDELYDILPAGGARNAIDCALWDLEAKSSGKPYWVIAGASQPVHVTTAFTLSLDTPEVMGERARECAHYSLLKLKLTGSGDLDRVRAVRENAPNSNIIVDANEAWTPELLEPYSAALVDLGVSLIEQPLPAADDDALLAFDSPIPICADESCMTSESVAALDGKYQFVNIKLDKTGGLTEALRLADTAEKAGYGLMVGCMAGSSLSMAPAFLVAQRCEFVDLDGPLLCSRDYDEGIRYDGNTMHLPSPSLWG